MKTIRLLLCCLAISFFLNVSAQNTSEEYKQRGDIAYSLFKSEQDKLALADILPPSKRADEEKMYQSMYDMYQNYDYALMGKKRKVTKESYMDMASKLKEAMPYFVNAGIYYYDKYDFAKATDFFLANWDIPTLKIYKKEELATDSIRQTIKYYAVICAIQSKDNQRSISLLNRIISEPYIQNQTYQESDPYELLASQYQQANDEKNYLKKLEKGVKKFPNNNYFMPNLINEYIAKDNPKGAIKFLDKALKSKSIDICTAASMKGSIYIEMKDMSKAEKLYIDALKSDPDCERALESIGIWYILKAQELKDKSNETKDKQIQANLNQELTSYYMKSLEPLNKYRSIIEKRNDTDTELLRTLLKLQNVYYNLCLYNMDFSAQYDKISTELENLRNK